MNRGLEFVEEAQLLLRAINSRIDVPAILTPSEIDAVYKTVYKIYQDMMTAYTISQTEKNTVVAFGEIIRIDLEMHICDMAVVRDSAKENYVTGLIIPFLHDFCKSAVRMLDVLRYAPEEGKMDDRNHITLLLDITSSIKYLSARYSKLELIQQSAYKIIMQQCTVQANYHVEANKEVTADSNLKRAESELNTCKNRVEELQLSWTAPESVMKISHEWVECMEVALSAIGNFYLTPNSQLEGKNDEE